eukprot:PLAT1307.1.p1 GENE.PLAT1307.1~~PLAT1307.1.p1  ORF type:complete len:696 (-),score=298.09 PLAT1307.1:49-1890(-)
MKQFYTDSYPRAGLGWIAFYGVFGVLVDCFTDPAMGFISDHTRTRWGRRRPFLALVPLWVAATYVLGWLAPGPPFSSHWYGIFHICWYLSETMYVVPYLSLGTEMSPSYKERNSIFTWSEMALIVGVLIGTVLPGPLGGATNPDILKGLAAIFSVLFIIANVILATKARERKMTKYIKGTEPGIVPTILQCFLNRPFRLLIVSDVVEAVGGDLPFVVLPYITRRVIGEDRMESGTLFSILAGVFILVRLICLPAWLWAADKFGKYRAYVFFNVALTVVTVLFIFISRDTIEFALLIGALWGSVYSGHALLFSLMSDVIDYDEFLTGCRREGQYNVFINFIPKFMEIPSQAIPFMLMAYYGYDPELEVQPEGVIWTLRLSISLVPALFTLLGVSFLLRYPLRTQDMHEEILRGIKEHRAGRAARDPITGRMCPPPQDFADLVSKDTKNLMDHFFPSELRRAARSGRVDRLRVQPIAMVLLGVAMLPLFIWVVVLGWASLDGDAEASVAPLGLMGIGVALVIIWFSATRWWAVNYMLHTNVTADEMEAYANFLYLQAGEGDEEYAALELSAAKSSKSGKTVADVSETAASAEDGEEEEAEEAGEAVVPPAAAESL